MSRRNFNADFKTKVVLEALKEVNTLAEIANKYKIYPQQITNWKKEFLSGASSVFRKGKALSGKSEAELEKDRLMRKIGEQAIENHLQPADALAKKLHIEIRSDNGPQFLAQKLREFFAENHLAQVFTHPYTPQVI